MIDTSSWIRAVAKQPEGKPRVAWVIPAEPFTAPSVFAFRLKFRLAKKKRIRFHVTADERYALFLDGKRIGRGPERGDTRSWFYHTYSCDLAAGNHCIVAQVWVMGAQGPLAQATLRPGFMLVAEAPFTTQLSTALAPWEAKRLGGLTFKDNGGRLPEYYCIGDDLVVDGAAYPWGFEKGEGSGWKPARPGEDLVAAIGEYGHPCEGPVYRCHLLRPSLLPQMMDRSVRTGKVRHAEQLRSFAELKKTVNVTRHDTAVAKAWEKVLRGSGSLRLAAKTRWRVLVDLGDYYCNYPHLIVSGGKGSRITLRWAESLYDNLAKFRKGDRGAIEGKCFNGIGDVFLPDGGKKRPFELLWWRAGCFAQFEIEVGQQPLIIEDFYRHETRYPLESVARFESDEPRLKGVNRIALRTLQMCSHETYMDCPYYEQLMYIGDTRLEVLTQYTISRDDRLPLKALEMFDRTRDATGLTASRYSERERQVIPPFSLWWIGSIHDYAAWRGDRNAVRERLPGARSVIDAWLGYRNKKGLLEMPLGWNYTDWVKIPEEWPRGIAPTGGDTVSSLLNWQVVIALGMLAELEAWCGEPERAQWAERQAAELGKKVAATFWNARKGLFANDPAQRHYSEHAQCLAVLSGRISAAQRNSIRRNLPRSKELGLARTTLYFTHYMFETCRALGLEKMWFERLGQWFELEKKGFKTVYETPEPSRSDCHAWGSSPLFHSQASILGIRPVGFGFHEVEIAPLLGPLREASGSLPHPHGTIRTQYVRHGRQLAAEIQLPTGVAGTLTWNGRKRKLAAGKKTVCRL